MASPAPLGASDTALNNLLAYASGRNVTQSAALSIRRLPGRGLGIYAAQPIQADTVVMHVPAAALFTPATVPLSFASKAQRRTIPVHALLAAYIAFGLSDDDRAAWSGWTGSWPTLTDFVTSMPLFWPASTRQPIIPRIDKANESSQAEMIRETAPAHRQQQQQHKNPPSATDTADDPPAPFIALPLNLVGPCTPSLTPSPTSPHLLDDQLDKFALHVRAITSSLPHVPATLADRRSPAHWRFAHAWACVNTRCFYHVAPGAKPPPDSNEAMALVPLMDLFNHTATPNCHVQYERAGFKALTLRDVAAGEELLLSYGGHGNDALLAEYGFMMGENACDTARLDDVVLRDLGSAERVTLEKNGFLGGYEVKRDEEAGVCFRTEAVSYLGLLSANQWRAFLTGAFDPERGWRDGGEHHQPHQQLQQRQREREPRAKKRRVTGGTTGTDSHADDEPAYAKAKAKQVSWCRSLADEAAHTVARLDWLSSSAQEELLLQTFADPVDVLAAQGIDEGEIGATRRVVARARIALCRERAAQMMGLCTQAIQSIMSAYPEIADEANGLLE